MFGLKNKTILITGASSGIGRQCAVSCSNMGAKVILFGRNKERLKETQQLLPSPEASDYYSINLTEYENVEKIINTVVQEHGQFDGLINAAGISTTLPLKLIKPEHLSEFYSVNVVSSINLTKLVTKKKNFKEKGSIIFITSIMGIVGEKGKTTYSLTKGALISGARSLAVELASRNIRINTISPGVVETPMSKNAVYSKDEESLNRIKSLHPLGLGQPEDVASACVFLLSDEAKWITGTNLIVDGGYTAK